MSCTLCTLREDEFLPSFIRSLECCRSEIIKSYHSSTWCQLILGLFASTPSFCASDGRRAVKGLLVSTGRDSCQKMALVLNPGSFSELWRRHSTGKKHSTEFQRFLGAIYLIFTLNETSSNKKGVDGIKKYLRQPTTYHFPRSRQEAKSSHRDLGSRLASQDIL